MDNADTQQTSFPRRLRSAQQRFEAKTQVQDDGCIAWTGMLRSGYGMFWFGVRMVAAHRFSYEHAKGAIPPGLHIDHLCRNRRCVNPQHLEAVTCRENVLRGQGPAAIHAAQTKCIRGHDFDESNTYVRQRGWRGCRICRREHHHNDRKSRPGVTA